MSVEDHNKGRRSWFRIIDYLQKLTGVTCTDGNINRATIKFKESIRCAFGVWWETEAFLRGRSKLDFYFSIKKTFGYEKYLDSLGLSDRIHITKLRLSGHCLPVEILRYNKKYPNREDRTCNICELNEVGDEKHYLYKCRNGAVADVRSNFFKSIKETCPQLAYFKDEDIITYCISMKDESIQEPTALFVKELYNTYKGEEKLPPLQIICLRHMGKLRK